jgi:two-component system chemotaxis response regulator CheY
MPKFLIADDNHNNRLLMQKVLTSYGDCDIVVYGKEAVDAFKMAMDDGEPYQFIFLDIMMPKMNGQDALKVMRKLERSKGIEKENGAKIIMATARDSTKDLLEALFGGGCNDYLIKPISIEKINKLLSECGLEKKLN